MHRFIFSALAVVATVPLLSYFLFSRFVFESARPD